MAPDITVLPSGETVETYPDGRIITRGMDGKITRSILPPNVAGDMGAKKKVFEGELATLLAEAGYTTEGAPAAIKRSAEIFLSGQSGAVAAGRLFLQLTRQPTTPEGANLLPGEPCPGCGRVVLPDYIQAEVESYTARLVGDVAGIVRNLARERE